MISPLLIGTPTYLNQLEAVYVQMSMNHLSLIEETDILLQMNQSSFKSFLS